jgi:Immunity protein 8
MLEVEIRAVIDETTEYSQAFGRSAEEIARETPRMIFIQIGPKGDDGSENFHANLHLDPEMTEEEPYRFYKGRIFGSSFSIDRLTSELEKLVHSVQVETWGEFGPKMTAFIHWEYDGFQT